MLSLPKSSKALPEITSLGRDPPTIRLPFPSQLLWLPIHLATSIILSARRWWWRWPTWWWPLFGRRFSRRGSRLPASVCCGFYGSKRLPIETEFAAERQGGRHRHWRAKRCRCRLSCWRECDPIRVGEHGRSFGWERSRGIGSRRDIRRVVVLALGSSSRALCCRRHENRTWIRRVRRPYVRCGGHWGSPERSRWTEIRRTLVTLVMPATDRQTKKAAVEVGGETLIRTGALDGVGKPEDEVVHNL
jgi:hypothetical protein